MRNLFLVLLVLLASCQGSGSSPEEEVRAWIDRGEMAAEQKDRGALLEMISADYADSHGNDRKHVGDLLRFYFLRQNSIALLTNIDEINVTGETAANVDLTIGMAGTRDSALGFSADALNFEFELIKPDDDWLLIGASWGELGNELL